MNIGICFSGGGIKGAAHIGVLKAFEEENIQFNYISGTSSGSIVARLYSIGYTADEIKEIFKKNYKKIKYIENKRIIKLILGVIFKREIIIDGLSSGEKIEQIIEKYSKQKSINNINQISKKVLIPSVDANNGDIYYFSSVQRNIREFSDRIIYINDCSVGKAVHASCSYPGVFAPCNYNNVKLIDGGIRENTPWRELKKCGAEKVICITFSEKSKNVCKKNIFDIVENSIKILNHELANYELEGVDFIIKIKTMPVKLLEIEKFDYLYELGYEYAKKFIEKNRNYLLEINK